MMMSLHGIAMLKEHEGLRLKAYQDAAGVWTIGWGHTGLVKRGATISEIEAEEYLAADVEVAERCVLRLVKVEMTQGQFDALVSFVFNLGCSRLAHSTLLRLLNGGDYEGAAEQFPRWNKAASPAGGHRVLPGLVKRREDERQRFIAKEDIA